LTFRPNSTNLCSSNLTCVVLPLRSRPSKQISAPRTTPEPGASPGATALVPTAAADVAMAAMARSLMDAIDRAKAGHKSCRLVGCDEWAFPHQSIKRPLVNSSVLRGNRQQADALAPRSGCCRWRMKTEDTITCCAKPNSRRRNPTLKHVAATEASRPRNFLRPRNKFSYAIQVAQPRFKQSPTDAKGLG
jgi:hypothetical protein